MSLADELGITEEQWQSASPELRDRLLENYGKVVGHRILQNDLGMQADWDEQRDRLKAVTHQLLTTDTHNCEDATEVPEQDEEMRVTILGDIQGDTAVNALRGVLPDVQQPEPKTTPPTTQPSTEPQPQSPVSAPKKAPGWQKAAAGAALVAGGIGAGALGTHLMQPKYVDLRDVKWEVVEETDLQGGVKIDVESD